MNVLLDVALPKPEYTPPASQCQISTSAPAIGLHVFAFSTVNTISSGRPGRPARRSRRVRPFSIQYGPSVTSGVSTQEAAAASASAVAEPRRVAPSTPPSPRVPIATKASRRRRPRRADWFCVSSFGDMPEPSPRGLGRSWEAAVR